MAYQAQVTYRGILVPAGLTVEEMEALYQEHVKQVEKGNRWVTPVAIGAFILAGVLYAWQIGLI